MKFYKTLSENYVLMVGTIGDTEIPESEYQTIVTKIQNKPSAPEGYRYRLRADNLEWELVEITEDSHNEELAEISDYENALSEMGVTFGD